MSKGGSMGGKFVMIGSDPVSIDRNWTSRVQNELNCTSSWQRDWGFLAGGSDHLNLEDATKPYSIDEMIQKKQDEMQALSRVDKLQTTNRVYGTGDNLERFQNKDNNQKTDKGLRPLERRLPATWKKDKWKPADDEYDPLKNMFKKKK